MLKSLIDIDVRKVAAIASILVLVCVPVSLDQIPGVPLAKLIPVSWVSPVEAWAGLIAWLSGLVTGSHNIAALVSPKVNS